MWPSHSHECPQQMEENYEGVRMTANPFNTYSKEYLVDVYMGCYKPMQMSLQTVRGGMILREYLGQSDAMYRTKKTFYGLPSSHSAIRLNHWVYTYGIFTVKAPKHPTTSELMELENPSLKRNIRDSSGNIIDTLDNHLYDDYFYVGRIKPTELIIDYYKDAVVFSRYVQEHCGCTDKTHIGSYPIPYDVVTPKVGVTLTESRDLIVTIPRAYHPNEKYVIEHETRKLPERDGLHDPNHYWTYSGNEEVYNMNLLYAYVIPNGPILD